MRLILTIANINSFRVLAEVNLLSALLLLPFPARSAEGINIRIFLVFALNLQVWQSDVWIQGAAAH